MGLRCKGATSLIRFFQTQLNVASLLIQIACNAEILECEGLRNLQI